MSDHVTFVYDNDYDKHFVTPLFYHIKHIHVQWSPSCEANLFVPEIWPFMRYGFSSEQKSIHLCLYLHSPEATPVRSGWPLKGDFIVLPLV